MQTKLQPLLLIGKQPRRANEYWKSQAYRFGVDIEDKDAFARMHFQVKGQGKGL
jgi:hypothetical protein